MMRKLVFIHGRAQEHKDAVALKNEWISALCKGLAKSGLHLPIPEEDILFPYYGQTLYDLVNNHDEAAMADVIVRGNHAEPQLAAFMHDVLDEVISKQGISSNQVTEEAEAARAILGDSRYLERGLLNWEWVQGLIAVIDKHIPGVSGAAIAVATADVYHYLTKPGVRDKLETGVRQAMRSGVEQVVVAHSLGTVVAYNLLRRDGAALGWRVPLLITLGSPLAISKIKRALTPLRHPECVGKWFNAMDPDDIVALHPLDRTHFPISPSIENKLDVQNDTDNQHGISGYLQDEVVAKKIYDALSHA